jgi:hypothetical protein
MPFARPLRRLPGHDAPGLGHLSLLRPDRRRGLPETGGPGRTDGPDDDGSGTGRPRGKTYRPVPEADRRAYAEAEAALEGHGTTVPLPPDRGRLSPVPDEPLPPPGALGFRVNLSGLTRWGDLLNAR